MAIENPRWGHTRIRGELMNLGYEVGRNTIKRVLAEHGIDPAGRRPMAWKTFLRARWGAIAATDFFTVEVVTWRGLVRYFVLFVIDLKSRRVEIAGITATPNGGWMQQVARNLVDCEVGFLSGSRYLIHDRDPLFTQAFGAVLRSADVDPVRLPVRIPNLNAYAERFVRSANAIFGESSASTSSVTTANEITKGLAIDWSIMMLPASTGAAKLNVISGSVGCFATTSGLRSHRSSFGTIRDLTAFCGGGRRAGSDPYLLRDARESSPDSRPGNRKL